MEQVLNCVMGNRLDHNFTSPYYYIQTICSEIFGKNIL
jgi:hypothetical protein